MDLEALPMSYLKNGEAEHNLYTQHRDLGSECECDSRRNRDLGSVGINISSCQGGNCGEERVSTAPISVRDRAEDMVGNMKPDVKSVWAKISYLRNLGSCNLSCLLENFKLSFCHVT